MSELLYLYGELDPRVRPLVFAVRKWAREHGLIEDARPTSFFTNFTLTLLVIFFLQVRHSILPSYSELIRLARPQDRIVCEDGVDCTFLRNVGGLQTQLNQLWNSPGDPSIAQLLANFFEFYAGFNFSRHAVCIISGTPRPKQHANRARQKQLSFYIDTTNPLEPDLNVSCNVQLHAVERFQVECRNSQEVISGMLHEGGDDVRISRILSGQGPFRLRLRVANLDWSGQKEGNGVRAEEEEREQVTVVQAPDRTSNKKESKQQERTYQEEKRKKEELRKASTRVRAPSAKQLMFRPKF